MKADSCSNTSFKSTLNEFCQKFRLPVPSYETVKSGNGFVSTLIYNKKVYQSSNPQKNKKLAEQNAAQVVLHKLGQAPAPEPSLQDAIQKCAEICSQVNASNSVSKTGENGNSHSLTLCFVLILGCLWQILITPHQLCSCCFFKFLFVVS